jgi:hypothetical protein
MISEHATQFANLPVEVFNPARGVADPERVVYRIATDWDNDPPFHALLETFLKDPNAPRVPALVIGAWQGDASDTSSDFVIQTLVKEQSRLTSLRALFLGDIVSEENEISWIEQSDVTPLLRAFPTLEQLRIRGGQHLQLHPIQHDRLRTLIVESGGLDGRVVRGIAASQLPALVHLELWLGTDEYGGNVTPDDVAPILAGDRFPALRYLGLRDAEGADAVAKLIASAPILKQLDTLDLSLGDLGNEGVAALAASPAVSHLKKLDIHHHYATGQALADLEALGIAIDASDVQTPQRWGQGEESRYIAVSE